MALRINIGHLRQGGVGCNVVMGDISVGVASDTAEGALHAASGLAKSLAAQLQAHPELQALLPPQITGALHAIHIASKIAKQGGSVADVAERVGPVAAKTVARILRSIL